MKDLFLGLKIARTRTVLSALVTTVITAGICIALSAFAPRGANTKNTIVISVSLIMIGCILLFLINRISSQKRKTEFHTMMNNGISHKNIRKQLIKEVLAVTLVFGVLGGAIGIGLSSPVSRMIMSRQSDNLREIPEFSQNESANEKTSDSQSITISNSENNNQDNEPPNGERPNRGEFNGERPDSSEFNGERPEGFPSNPDKPSNFGENKTNGNMGMRYVIPASVGGMATLLFMIFSALGVASPIKKQED